MTTQAVILLGLQAIIIGTVFSFGMQATVPDALFLVRHRSGSAPIWVPAHPTR